jgi:hypothetical protein
MLNQALDAAWTDGFSGLRTYGDMSWPLENPPGSELVVEYEALLNQFFSVVCGCGMCQYDRQRLPPELIDHALTTHPSTVIGGHHTLNPFYRSSEIANTRKAQPADVLTKLAELRRRTPS